MASSRLSREDEQRAKENAKKAKQFPPAVQFAIVAVVPNIVNGCFWGFTDYNDIMEHVEVIRQTPEIVARKVQNACIVEVQPNYLLKAVNAIDSTMFNQKDMNVMKESMAKAQVGFEQYLINRAITKKGEQFCETIAIYCTNDTERVSIKDKTYNAFRVTMADLLKYFGMYGYKVRCGSRYVTVQEAAQNSQAVWDATRVAPSKTGLLIDIQNTMNLEVAKRAKENFKAKYGLTTKKP